MEAGSWSATGFITQRVLCWPYQSPARLAEGKGEARYDGTLIGPASVRAPFVFSKLITAATVQHSDGAGWGLMVLDRPDWMGFQRP